MGHVNLPASKRNPRQWTVLDIVSAVLFALVLLFFLLVFTPLGDSMSASGRQALFLSTSDPRQRHRLVSLVELGHHHKPIEACPADSVDHMPCEDPRRNSQLSREMNWYRERHCPLPDEMPLCLIPPPPGYKIPVQWPESLHKYIPITGGTLRTALDMGCGVASFGGSLLSEGILTLSFAPRDSHKSQIQFALERGIPAFVLVLGTRRLPVNGKIMAFADATYFVEVDRLLRPGGYLVISGPPVQWPKQDKEWAELQYFKLRRCVTPTSFANGEFPLGMIPKWPDRLTKAPSRALVMKNGIDLFQADTRRWTRRVAYYKNTLNLKLGTPAVRNVMDMNAFFGGFAAALTSYPVWVMNVVPARKPLTLGVIYDRCLIGLYHDWCEPFSTYPRTYDFIHVAGIESLVELPDSSKSRCSLVDLMVEMDRILRPEGTAVIRDSPEVIDKVARIAHAVRWMPTIHDKEPESHGREKILVATKTFWKLTSPSH
ncbi:putative methyltransferase PMT13 [Hibiscus syriacus]|uniref:Methyltransferase n=1 Tax=Hibiscus syriacus TaxID=106335 RepID=A0A6A3CW45_HIBSY|nr:putative methyltransferase PMT13 [Hibiscus syriacus]